MVGPPRPPYPSAPSDPNLRRLGVGSPGQKEKPVRAQLIVALVAGLILLAVPLYLWRRPALRVAVGADAAPASSPSGAAVLAPPIVVPTPDAGAPSSESVTLGPVRKVRCGNRRKNSEDPALCDTLSSFEKALAEAITKTADCAPRLAKGGSINHVLELDFVAKTRHVFPGASGEWRGPSARRATRCVEKALPQPDWDGTEHRYRHYTIAILATYPPRESERK